jgi:MFS transporter, ACS family, hexuronate transporter
MSSRARGLLLTLLILAGILNYADRQLIAVLKPLLQERLHWDDADYGRLTTVFQFAAALALLGSGWIVDRVGWRAANALSVASSSLATMAHVACRTFAQFTVARVALGATVSLGTPAAVKTIAENFSPGQRSMAFGSLNAAGNAGAIITPLVTPAIALAWGWSGGFLLVGALGLVWVLAWVIFVRSLVPEQYGDRANELQPAAGGRASELQLAAGGWASEQPPTAAPVSFGDVLTQRRTWAIAGGKALSDSVWWFLLFWSPDFFHRVFHLSMQEFALPLALIYSAAALGALVGGVVSSRLIANGMPVVAARKAVMLMCALLVLPAPAALFVHGYWAAVLVLGLTLAAHQGFSVNLFALVTDVTAKSSVATTISIGALCGNLAGMGILRVAGEAVGSEWGYGVLFGFTSVAYLLALLWIQCFLPATTALSEVAPV